MSSFLVVSSVVLFVFAVVRSLRLRRASAEQRPMLWSVCAMLVARGVALLVLAPAVAAPVDRLTTIPNFSFLVALLFLVVAAACAQNTFGLVRGEGAETWPLVGRWVLLFGFLVVGVAALVVVLGTAEVSTEDFLRQYARTQYLAELLAMYFAAYVMVTVYLSFRWLRWVRAQFPCQVWLRLGVRITAGGNLVFLGLGYSGVSLAVVVARSLGADVGRWPAVALVAAAAGTLPVVIGMGLSAWGPCLHTACKRVAQCRRDFLDYRRLRPLWLVLRPVAPEMVHGSASWRERLSLRSKLFWRVIEIDDWLHRLSAAEGIEILPDNGRPRGAGLGGVLNATKTARMRSAFADERELLVEVARSLAGASWAGSPGRDEEGVGFGFGRRE